MKLSNLLRLVHTRASNRSANSVASLSMATISAARLLAYVSSALEEGWNAKDGIVLSLPFFDAILRPTTKKKSKRISRILRTNYIVNDVDMKKSSWKVFFFLKSKTEVYILYKKV
jgi:hypothetical protein